MERDRDVRDDPFFTRPFGSLFGSSMFSSGVPVRESSQASGSKGPLIEELLTDDDEEKEEKCNQMNNNNSLVEHPDDLADVHPGEFIRKDVTCKSDNNKVQRPKTNAPGVSFKKVTYGGIDGAYYTATTTTRSGSNGVVLEECRQADRTTGEATHRISRGVHDKGHSVTRTLNSDGKVDTLQTLHNLDEEELAGFEQTWKGNAERHLPRWDHGINLNNAAGASNGGGRRDFNQARTSSSDRRPKKVVQINID